MVVEPYQTLSLSPSLLFASKCDRKRSFRLFPRIAAFVTQFQAQTFAIRIVLRRPNLKVFIAFLFDFLLSIHSFSSSGDSLSLSFFCYSHENVSISFVHSHTRQCLAFVSRIHSEELYVFRVHFLSHSSCSSCSARSTCTSGHSVNDLSPFFQSSFSFIPLFYPQLLCLFIVTSGLESTDRSTDTGKKAPKSTRVTARELRAKLGSDFAVDQRTVRVDLASKCRNSHGPSSQNKSILLCRRFVACSVSLDRFGTSCLIQNKQKRTVRTRWPTVVR
jgi:hypothetical protein